MDINLAKQLVDYVQLSDAIATLVQKDKATKTAQQKKVAELIPNVVSALIKNKRLPEELSQKAASVLNDPVKALEVLINTANHRTGNEAQTFGTEVTHQKKASVRGSVNSPYCGVRTTEERDSDRVMLERLGLR